MKSTSKNRFGFRGGIQNIVVQEPAMNENLLNYDELMGLQDNDNNNNDEDDEDDEEIDEGGFKQVLSIAQLNDFDDCDEYNEHNGIHHLDNQIDRNQTENKDTYSETYDTYLDSVMNSAKNIEDLVQLVKVELKKIREESQRQLQIIREEVTNYSSTQIEKRVAERLKIAISEEKKKLTQELQQKYAKEVSEMRSKIGNISDLKSEVSIHCKTQNDEDLIEDAMYQTPPTQKQNYPKSQTLKDQSHSLYQLPHQINEQNTQKQQLHPLESKNFEKTDQKKHVEQREQEQVIENSSSEKLVVSSKKISEKKITSRYQDVLAAQEAKQSRASSSKKNHGNLSQSKLIHPIEKQIQAVYLKIQQSESILSEWAHREKSYSEMFKEQRNILDKLLINVGAMNENVNSSYSRIRNMLNWVYNLWDNLEESFQRRHRFMDENIIAVFCGNTSQFPEEKKLISMEEHLTDEVNRLNNLLSSTSSLMSLISKREKCKSQLREIKHRQKGMPIGKVAAERANLLSKLQDLTKQVTLQMKGWEKSNKGELLYRGLKYSVILDQDKLYCERDKLEEEQAEIQKRTKRLL